MQHRFDKSHRKSHSRRKSGRGSGLVKLAKILGSSIFFAVAEAIDVKFGCSFFAKARHKITPRAKMGVELGLESSQKFGDPFIFLQI